MTWRPDERVTLELEDEHGAKGKSGTVTIGAKWETLSVDATGAFRCGLGWAVGAAWRAAGPSGGPVVGRVAGRVGRACGLAYDDGVPEEAELPESFRNVARHTSGRAIPRRSRRAPNAEQSSKSCRTVASGVERRRNIGPNCPSWATFRAMSASHTLRPKSATLGRLFAGFGSTLTKFAQFGPKSVRFSQQAPTCRPPLAGGGVCGEQLSGTLDCIPPPSLSSSFGGAVMTRVGGRAVGRSGGCWAVVLSGGGPGERSADRSGGWAVAGSAPGGGALAYPGVGGRSELSEVLWTLVVGVAHWDP